MGGPEKPKRTIKAPIKKTRQDLIIEKYGKRAAYLIKNRLSGETLRKLGILKKGCAKNPTSKKIEKQKTSIIDPRNRIRSKYIELSTGLSEKVKKQRFDEFKKHYEAAIQNILLLPFSSAIKQKYGINNQQLIKDFQRILNISHIESHLNKMTCSGVARGYSQLVDHYFYSRKKRRYLKSCHSMASCLNTMKEKNKTKDGYRKISNRYSPRIEVNRLLPVANHFTESDIYDPTKNIIMGLLYYKIIDAKYISAAKPFKQMSPDSQHKFTTLAYSRGASWVKVSLRILQNKGHSINSYQDYENAWEKVARDKLNKYSHSRSDIRKVAQWKKKRDAAKKAGEIRTARYYNRAITRLEAIINQYKTYKLKEQNSRQYGIPYRLPKAIADLKNSNRLRVLRYGKYNLRGRHIWEGLRYIRVMDALMKAHAITKETPPVKEAKIAKNARKIALKK